ncbi:unnamed protein product, partial [Protopolystoma xenopodis]
KTLVSVVKARDFPVESDANKLVNSCCISYRIDEKPIALGADGDYPAWLWKLHVDRKPRPIAEIDINSYAYWRRVRKYTLKYWNSLAKIDGWHRKDHRETCNHAEKFYKEWSQILMRDSC